MGVVGRTYRRRLIYPYINGAGSVFTIKVVLILRDAIRENRNPLRLWRDEPPAKRNNSCICNYCQLY